MNATPVDTEAEQQRFVKKACITLLSRKAGDSDFERADSLFQTAYDEARKAQLIRQYLQQEAFILNMENQLRSEYLEGATMREIRQYMIDFDLLLTIETQALQHDEFEHHFESLSRLRKNVEAYRAGAIDLMEVQMRLIDNYVYDQINMGHDNFVLSVFQHLFMRKPTKFELAECKKMLLNQTGVLFGKTGRSKAELMQIMFASDHYFEGQVRYWFMKLINREPKLEELVLYVKLLKEKQSLESLFEAIFAKEM
jgi:hypothetical protein